MLSGDRMPQNEQPLRMTRQRQIILEELRKVTSHPGADEIYGMVRKRLPRISLGTIYRNLERLSRTGEIQKLESGGGQKRFDGNAQHHYHIRCLECSRIDDVELSRLDTIESKAACKTDFLIAGHRLEFVGLCPNCRDSHQSIKH